MDQNQMMQLMLMMKLLGSKKNKNKNKNKPELIANDAALSSVERYRELYEKMSYTESHPDAHLFDGMSGCFDTESLVSNISARCASSVMSTEIEYKGTTQTVKDHMLEKAEYYGNVFTCHIFDVSKDIENGVYDVTWNFGTRAPLFDGDIEAVRWVSNPIGLDVIEFSLYVHQLYAYMWDNVRHCRDLYEHAGRDKSYINKVIFTNFEFLVIDGKAVCIQLEMESQS